MNAEELVRPVREFLHCATPEAWLIQAVDRLDVILLDHAHCEKKAASTGLSLIYRYADKPELLRMLSQLVREEMLHFEQVLDIMEKRGLAYGHLSASSYAASLHRHASKEEPQRLLDQLIIGAIIEARSCERFFVLSAYVEDELAQYYRFLLKSESRHFEDYLFLARQYGADEPRVQFFLEEERKLIEGSDPLFRFHSGVPA